jgi:hypothetical protein
LDPKDQRSRTPSLLAGDSHSSGSSGSAGRVLSEVRTDAQADGQPRRQRSWVWIGGVGAVALCAIVLLRFGGAFSGTRPAQELHADGLAQAGASTVPTRPAGRNPSDGPTGNVGSTTPQTAPNLETEQTQDGAATSKFEGSRQSPSSPSGRADGGLASGGAAVILSSSSDGQAAVDGKSAPSAVARGTTASPSKDAMDLSVKLTPPAERKHSSNASQASRASDSDVSLLTVLLQHVEMDGSTRRSTQRVSKHPRPAPQRRKLDAVEVLMQKCAAANTERGLRCRQRICARHRGESKACPTALAGTGTNRKE